MPKTERTHAGIWSVEANNARFQQLSNVNELVTRIMPTQAFRTDLLAFYDATRLLPHPQLLPFHPDEEEPSANPENGGNGVHYELKNIEILTIKNWQIDQGSFRGMCFALEHCQLIHTVQLFNVQLSVEEVEQLCLLIPQTAVTVFHLEWNASFSKSDEASLPPSAIDALLSPSSKVTALSFRASGLSSVHADAIAKALRANTTLQVLNLFQNTVGDEGALAIAYALPFNSTLKSLSLGNTAISGKAARVLVDVLTKYVAPPSLLQELEEAEPRIQSELDQAKKAKKKIDRATAMQNLGLPLLETIDGEQYAPGNSVIEDLVLSGNKDIQEDDLTAMNAMLETHHAKLEQHLKRIRLQRIPALKAVTHPLSPLLIV
ncbi:hypothetical protein Poli38472_010574 [Pythium oligandrum]|uniref:Tropomodulin n=1 Tax=Pythium oligandrum TaxID=41045 RepID=A0A8K1C3Y3_PYTOL|nr:hypothetical protein Poli38472_010574 [Pythium oligandrum]|eukprot:TMW55692.1 hypothetical protein Poli38472_010574 [Pythium oligandrum]